MKSLWPKIEVTPLWIATTAVRRRTLSQMERFVKDMVRPDRTVFIVNELLTGGSLQWKARVRR